MKFKMKRSGRGWQRHLPRRNQCTHDRLAHKCHASRQLPSFLLSETTFTREYIHTSLIHKNSNCIFGGLICWYGHNNLFITVA